MIRKSPHLPLEGIVVVAVEHAVAAPFATRQLADLGARVIKVERPDTGDFARSYDGAVQGCSSYFAWLNRLKQSIAINIKEPEGSLLLLDLIDRADVVLHNLAPAAAERAGLRPEQLVTRRPRLIAGEISGYGDTGPYHSRRAYDALVQGEAGLLSVTGTESEPCKVGISVADIAAGMYALTGVLAALYEREVTGRGCSFSVSLLDALGEWMQAPVLYALGSGRTPRRSGAHHATIAPYGPIATMEGRLLNIAIQNDREWKRFCRIVLQSPSLDADPRFATNIDRVANLGVLKSTLAALFAQLTFAEAVARLDEADIAYGRINSLHEFANHPQLEARGRWREVRHAHGSFRALCPPLIRDGNEGELGSVPTLGEHTDLILTWLGYNAEDVDNLRRAGVIGGPVTQYGPQV